MINYIKRVADYLLGRNVDNILKAFNAADRRLARRLARLVEREQRKQARNGKLQAELFGVIANLERSNDASRGNTLRAERIKNRIQELVA